MRIGFLPLLITAIALAISANAQDSGVEDMSLYNSISERMENGQYLIYDDHAHELWRKIKQHNSQRNSLPEYENTFYGKKIKFAVVSSDRNDDSIICSISDPTLFWELLAIYSKGDRVKCEEPKQN